MRIIPFPFHFVLKFDENVADKNEHHFFNLKKIFFISRKNNESRIGSWVQNVLYYDRTGKFGHTIIQ